MIYKYGEFSRNQMAEIKERIRKRIFFILLVIENKENQYDGYDVNGIFESEMTKIGGFNGILNKPVELVEVQVLLEAARIEYNSPDFNWFKCRKLLLDAGNEIKKVKED